LPESPSSTCTTTSPVESSTLKLRLRCNVCICVRIRSTASPTSSFCSALPASFSAPDDESPASERELGIAVLPEDDARELNAILATSMVHLSINGWGSYAAPSITLGLLEQAKDCLRQLLGLSQDRSTSLLQDLVLAQRCSCSSKVSVLDTAAGGGDVFLNVLKVSNSVFKAILHGTETRSRAIYLRKGTIDYFDSVMCTFRFGYIDCTYGGHSRG